MSSSRPAPRALDRDLLAQVVALGEQNVQQGGRPFACIIASTATGEVLAAAGNQVAQTGDPTAHAEMVAIREASMKLRALGQPVDGRNGGIGEDFKGYSFYILTAPCAMCMAAMEYCGPDAIWYATTREDYCVYYRDDRRYFEMENLYAEVARPHEEKRLPMARIADERAIGVYSMWAKVNAKPAGGSTSAAAGAGAAGTGAVATATAPVSGRALIANGAAFASVDPAKLAECPFAPPGARSSASKLPILLPTGPVDSRRPEVEHEGRPVPAWGKPAEVGPILAAREQAWDRLINTVATRGDPVRQLYMTMRDLNLLTRAHYAQMIHNVGRNLYPLIVASDYEPGFNGVGGTFTLYLADGSSRRIAPAPPVYELYKALSHMALGVFAQVSPYFRTPAAAGWREPLEDYRRVVRQGMNDAALAEDLPADVRQHAADMLGLVDGYCSRCLEAGRVDVAAYMEFTRALLPLIQKSVMNASRLQAHAALPELQRWKQELGPKLWREVYVLIPTVWPVSGRNPREQMFEMLLDADRVATHIIKAEGAKDIEEARTTLGRVIGDRTVAQLVFGTESADSRNLVSALSTPRDIVTSACDDALHLFTQLGGEFGAAAATACIMPEDK